MTAALHIDGRAIGPLAPPYVIAEMSANHLGDRERALAILEAAHRAGADALKLQTYTPEGMTLDLHGPGFSIEEGPWRGETLFELYARAQTPWSWHAELFARGRDLGITVFSSPFDEGAVARLMNLGAPAFKIASFELVDHELVRAVAQTGQPLILSTGMARFDEIEEALAVARAAGAHEIALLHCVSGYPTPPDEANLLRLPALARRFDVQVGLSDHSPGTAVAVAAVALGARVIEKHLTLARADGGPDAGFSLEPKEFAALVRGCRVAYEALGSGRERDSASQRPNEVFRRSLYLVADVAAGEVLTPRHVRAIRPGLGLAPRELPRVLGRVAARDLARGTPLAWDHLAPLSAGQEARRA